MTGASAAVSVLPGPIKSSVLVCHQRGAIMSNKALYEIAMKELDGKKDETLWMMALVATGGDEFEA